jgi:hypothetical protein
MNSQEQPIVIINKQQPTIQNNILTGSLVGILDIIFLWPFVTVAARRESGTSLQNSLQQGKLWAGARTAASTLIPYSIALETLSGEFTRQISPESQLQQILIATLVGLCVAGGLQPIEKKLVVEQLLQAQQNSTSKQYLTLHEFWQMAKNSPIGPYRWLGSGFVALWLREIVYVSAVTVVTPILWRTKWKSPDGMAFCVGFSAGMISAPIQTLNVLMKDERNVKVYVETRKHYWGNFNVRLKCWIDALFREGEKTHTAKSSYGYHLINRMFYGSLSRSFRIGGVSILWMRCREWVNTTTANNNL